MADAKKTSVLPAPKGTRLYKNITKIDQVFYIAGEKYDIPPGRAYYLPTEAAAKLPFMELVKNADDAVLAL